METIKVENVKEAIDEIYRKIDDAEKYKRCWNLAYYDAKRDAYSECITILENLIVRRQRNEPR